jgi:hypothetical protein
MSTKSTAANITNLFLGSPMDALTGSISITMRVNKYYTNGALLQKGNSYTVTKDWAKTALDRAWAFELTGAIPAQDTPITDQFIKQNQATGGLNTVAGARATARSAAASTGSLVILLSAATNISATGAITGLTALPFTPAGTVQVYCFAQTGLVAGLYYAVFSSTMACQLYMDAAATITPTGITAGAYTSNTTAAILASFTVGGGAIGPNGLLEIYADFGRPNSANSILTNITYSTDNSGQTGLPTASATFGGRATYRLRNLGAVNRNIRAHESGANPGYSNTFTQLAVDTSVDQTATIQATLSNTADFLFLAGYNVEIVGKD